MATKTVKGTKVPKEVKESKVAEKKSVKEKVVNPEEGVELISFSVSAVIPTQQYGNIQPKIEVRGHSIKRAREIVMPIMEEIYKTYAETPLSGKEPKFYGGASVTEKVVGPVTVSEKVVAPALPKAQEAVHTAPALPSSVEPASPAPSASVQTAPSATKPEPVMKAEKAISLAVTPDAVEVIENQIKNSVKIMDEFKPDLLKKCAEKRAEVTPF